MHSFAQTGEADDVRLALEERQLAQNALQMCQKRLPAFERQFKLLSGRLKIAESEHSARLVSAEAILSDLRDQEASKRKRPKKVRISSPPMKHHRIGY